MKQTMNMKCDFSTAGFIKILLKQYIRQEIMKFGDS
jgi:hypothetical protein